MPDRPFDKIKAGLDDAIAYSKGDTSRGRRHDIPVNEADRQARAAFRDYTIYYQSALVTAAVPPVALAGRTYDRIFAGKRDVPPGVARELAAHIRAMIGSPVPPNTDLAKLESWAAQLDGWADDCEQRSKDRRHG